MLESHQLIAVNKGLQDYEPVWRAMQGFINDRDDSIEDQVWCVEHPPVFTQGQAGKPEHVLNPGSIPIVKSDRGGQVTYHGPGQAVIYPLLNLRRLGLGVRDLVTLIEASVVEMLSRYGVKAFPKPDAPGVYVEQGTRIDKIASLGLRIRKGQSYHGVSINVDMDLEPFARINPCGFDDLKMTQIASLKPAGCPSVVEVQNNLVEILAEKLALDLTWQA